MGLPIPTFTCVNFTNHCQFHVTLNWLMFTKFGKWLARMVLCLVSCKQAFVLHAMLLIREPKEHNAVALVVLVIKS